MPLQRLSPDAIKDLKLDNFELPPHLIHGLFGKSAYHSVVESLGRRAALPYGDSVWYGFHDHDAQLVDRGTAKEGSEMDVEGVQFHTHWFQKTVRFYDADLLKFQSYGLSITDDLFADFVVALKRALDYAVLHGIDPRTGVTAPTLEAALHDAPTLVDVTGAPIFGGVDEAQRAVWAAGYRPNGIAIDSTVGGVLATSRSGLTEALPYPNFNAVGVSQL